MKIADLFAIGKLGNKLNSEGYILFRKKKKYTPYLLKTKDIFLLFTDHRVRYVTIEDELEGSILLKERDIAQEAVQDGNVQVLIAKEDYTEWNDAVQIEPYIHFSAEENRIVIGRISDYIIRPLQNLFEVELKDGKIFYVPHVANFVKSIDEANKKISFCDLTELKEL